MSSGYTPISATIAKEEIWQAVEDTKIPFLAGHTMNQNPTSCAGAIANMKYVEEHDLMGNARRTGAYLLKRLKDLVENYDILGDARGKGMMCGIEFVKNKTTKEPFDPKLKVAWNFERECLDRGLVTFNCSGCVEGVAGDMALVTPPLITTPAQVDEIIAVFEDALGALQEKYLA
jgi:adenosylmethionine-8-amino-7-oxononanoate aminotransferase